MKYAIISDLNFAIQILKLNADKLPADSYAKLKVATATNHVIFELEDMIKILQKEQELEKERQKHLDEKIKEQESMHNRDKRDR